MENKEGLDRREFLKQAPLCAGGLFLGAQAAVSHARQTDATPCMEWDFSQWTGTPKNLCQETHDLARLALSGEHGRSLTALNLPLDALEGLSNNMRYARAAMLVAQNAPLPILPGEKIVGSATLLEATRHATPLVGVGSTSHTTIGFHTVLKTGYKGLRARIAERLCRGGLDERSVDLLNAMEVCLDAATVWHQRHMDLLDRLAAESQGGERENYLRVREALGAVPENPPETFHEAVQSLWFMYAFQRLMGNWSGIGRIDQMLGPYLQRDLKARRITRDEAREILAHFWIKGCEWIGSPGSFGAGSSGDAQFYQNIVLGGIDADGCDVTNDVTYLILDVVGELHISDYPIAVRINSKTSKKLLRRIAEVQRRGGGIVAVYNEKVAIDGLVKFGYSLEEAREFANDGCWEAIIPGKTCFTYQNFDMLALLHTTLALRDKSRPIPEFSDFDALYEAYITNFKRELDARNEGMKHYSVGEHPSPLLDMFVEGCIEKGRGYHNRGAKYTVYAHHAGGMADAANSLLALRKLVYEEKYLSLSEFIGILRDNWQGNEPLRNLVGSRFEFYGNDNDEADAMVERLFQSFTDLVGASRENHGVLNPAGISTFGREIVWSHPDANGHRPRTASPDGHQEGDVQATNFSPCPGTDKKGPTAVLKSYCKMDFTRVPNGATVELKIHPASVEGEAGIDALTGLMKTFVRMGGYFMHIDVVDSAMLIDAQRHPEKYPNLAVRVAGWSARFATLDKTWQDMVIARTQQII